MKVRWLHVARTSLVAIADYIAEENPYGAHETLVRIKAAADALSHHPHIGRPGRVEGTRELVVTDTPYLLAYRVHNGEVQILHVLHHARKWPECF